MLKLLLIVLLCFLCLQIQGQTCEPTAVIDKSIENLFCNDMSGLDSQLHGLTPLWNLEVMGIDFMKETLKTRSTKPSKIAIIETGISGVDPKPFKSKKFFSFSNREKDDLANQRSINHGAKVTNLIFDSKFGTAVNSKLAALIETNNGRADKLPEAIAKLGKSQGRIVNMSGASGSDTKSLLEWQKVSSNGKIVVLASGNSYPLNQSSSSNADKFKNIGVGSIDPFGLVSPFSIQGSHVTVLAPCDFYSYSKGPNDVLATFNGTSCSAPLVSGVLANVLSILPDITAEDLTTLLKNTSIKTRIQFDSSRNLNGVGMLNAYKIILAAKRLKERGYTKNRGYLVNASDIYDFKKESEKFLKDISQKRTFDRTCSGRLANLNIARKAFFLDSENPEAINKVSDAYKEMNLPVNALFFTSLSDEKDFGKKYLNELLENKTKTKIDDPEQATNYVGERALIYASRIDENHPFVHEVMERIEKLSDSSNADSRREAVKMATLLGPRGFQVLKKLSQDKNSEISKMAKSQLSYIELNSFDFVYPDRQKFND